MDISNSNTNYFDGYLPNTTKGKKKIKFVWEELRLWTKGNVWYSPSAITGHEIVNKSTTFYI